MRKRKLEIPLPCPWCGSIPNVFPTNPKIEGNAWGAVKCMNKKCYVNPECDDSFPGAYEVDNSIYKNAAIRRWNKRK